MPYLNPEDKKAWKAKYRHKQLEYQRDWNRRQREKQMPIRLAARIEKETKKEKRENARVLRVVVNELINEAMDRDYFGRCYACGNIIPIAELKRPMNKGRSGQCRSCRNKEAYAWRKTNPEKYKNQCKIINTRNLSNPYKRIEIRLRDLTNKHMKWGGLPRKGRCSSLKYIGCDRYQLRSHIESQFKDGMSWDNYGQIRGVGDNSRWHVDHIIPISAFDLTIEENRHKAFHFSNLQPMWGLDNIRKGGCRTPAKVLGK